MRVLNLFICLFIACNFVFYRKGTRLLTLSPVQWVTSYLITYVSPLTGDTIIQTSKLNDFDHIIDIINKYKVSESFALILRSIVLVQYGRRTSLADYIYQERRLSITLEK